MLSIRIAKHLKYFCYLCVAVLIVGLFSYWYLSRYKYEGLYSVPLVKAGGDPYIRALMRLISISENNTRYPYHSMYGHYKITQFDNHPGNCIAIRTRINRDLCSTAAGRYQILQSTWKEKSTYYFKKELITPNFSPATQDELVYRWLSDPNAWGMNLHDELENDHLHRVLKRLSGTWTSLGYGIESNRNTRYLPKIFPLLLAEELQAASEFDFDNDLDGYLDNEKAALK